MTGPLVVKIGGATVEDAATAPALFDALAKVAAREGGMVLVHGGGRAVDRLIERLGFKTERLRGLRVTPPEQMDVIAGVLAGSMNKGIVAQLIARGVRAVGVCLGDGMAVEATKMGLLPEGDLGNVGDVRIAAQRDPSGLLSVLLAGGFTPVVSSIGIDRGGTLLNVNADDAAAAAAGVVGASALVLMTDVPGILVARKQVVPEVDAAAIEDLITAGIVTGGMAVKTRAASAAARAIGTPVVIMAGNSAAALAELAAGRMTGTTVLPH